MSNYNLSKSKNRNKKENDSYSFFNVILNKILITGLLTITCMIFLKKDLSFKKMFYDNVIENNFNFASLNSLYTKYFGGTLPFSNVFESTETVFNENLSYDSASDYMDGVSLSVGSDYLVPSIDSGLVVFVGEKDGYGNTVIIQTSDGVDIWYSNMNDISVDMYEYVSKGGFIGNCRNNLVLVFKKDGKVIDYKKYI